MTPLSTIASHTFPILTAIFLSAAGFLLSCTQCLILAASFLTRSGTRKMASPTRPDGWGKKRQP